MEDSSSPSGIRKLRNSSVELYRILATFAVIIVHFNGWFVEAGLPEKYDLSDPTYFRAGQMIIESATCICVNMFLVISGYFGINFRLSSLLRIALLLLFVKVPFFFLNVVYVGSFDLRGLAGSFLIFSNAGYFILCYLMLMFMSPMLNAFVDKYGKRVLPWSIALLMIEFYFDAIRGPMECLGVMRGYAITHFVLMYILARCLFLYRKEIMKIKARFWVYGYVICIGIICFFYILGIEWTFWYSNPVVIISSLCSFIPFIYYNYYIRSINWIASSTFAVYIIQVTRPAYDLLVRIDNLLLNSFTYSQYLVYSFVIISLFFTFCILYDKFCGLFISPIINKLKYRIDQKFEFK